MTSGPLTDDDVRRIEREIAGEVRDDARSISAADEAILTLADRLHLWHGRAVRIDVVDGGAVVGTLESRECLVGHVIVLSNEGRGGGSAARHLIPLPSLVQVDRDPQGNAPVPSVISPDRRVVTRSLGSVLREHHDAGGEIRAVMVTDDVLTCAARAHVRVGVDHLEVDGRIVVFAGVRRWTLAE